MDGCDKQERDARSFFKYFIQIVSERNQGRARDFFFLEGGLNTILLFLNRYRFYY